MIKKYFFILFTFIFTVFFGYGQSVFISQYTETNKEATPKGIEVFNNSGADIIFSSSNNLQVYQGINGGACSSIINISSGTLKANEVWVIGTSDLTSYAMANGTNLSGTSIFSFTFNGDDALQLYLGGVLQDVFGTCGSDPGSSWSGGGVSTRNNNLEIKNGICVGTTTSWTNPSTRFNQIAIGSTMTGFGNAPSGCSVSTPTINLSTNGLVGLDYAVGLGPSASQTFTASGTNLTANITLTAPANFEISTISGSGYGSLLTLTQSGGTVNATTIYVRLITGLLINAYTGNLTATSIGATTQNITFNGDVLCIPTHTITGFAPTSGPVGTEVTITGTGFSASSTANFNGIPAIVTFKNSTTLIAKVPSGATTYFVSVVEGSCNLNSSSNFTVLTDNGCISGGIPAGWTDLMFTGIYDDNLSSCHYFELFNSTGLDIDLSAFSIGFDNNFTYGSIPPTSGFSGGSINLSGIIAAGSTFMIRVSSGGPCNSCSTIVPDLSFENNSGINVDDRLVLFSGSTVKDVLENHSSRPGFTTGFNKGYIFKRKLTAIAPKSTFNIADWDAIDPEDCFGFAISATILPNIITQPINATGCSSATFSTIANAGSGGLLTYQWKYNNGSSTGWTNVSSSSFLPGTVIGETTNSLTISGFDVYGFQFYCEVKENGTCAVSSDAVQVKTTTTTWNGTTWNNGSPNISTSTVINGNYNTNTNGSFSTCNLFVNAGFNISVDNSTYVEVQNNTFIDGHIVVETKGAFVQNNDLGVFTVHSGGSSSVNKTTAYLNNWYNYTDWSSPVLGETVENALSIAPPSRRFYFNAVNFVDLLQEVGNTGTFINNPGVDDIDDNGNDWQLASGVMTPGVGYTSTVNPTGFVAGPYTTSFNGSFNNGIIQTGVVNNSGGLYNDWNFIGNPYPSAINALTFLTDNATLVDAFVYLWSQATPYDGTIAGNYVNNFSNSDYATITGSGVNVAGASGIIPNNFIPSGQGFFVEAIAPGNVTFNNAMRIADISSNSQFFRSSNSNKNKNQRNILWINLKSDNGVFNQLAVAYLTGATNAYDGSFYDVKRSESSGNASVVYSTIDGNSGKYAIQGKNENSLNLGEIISIGFNTSINVPTKYSLSVAQTEGDFFKNNPIYLKDNFLKRYHDLSKSEYSFTSDVGEYNDRFKLVFIKKAEIENEFNLPKNDVLVIDIGANEFNFIEVDNSVTIKSIEIIDILGKLLRNYKGVHNSEIVDLSGLKPNIYISKIKLSNNQIVIKKIIKKE